MHYPFYNLYYFTGPVEMPKEFQESNKVKMEKKVKKESEKYRVIRK